MTPMPPKIDTEMLMRIKIRDAANLEDFTKLGLPPDRYGIEYGRYAIFWTGWKMWSEMESGEADPFWKGQWVARPRKGMDKASYSGHSYAHVQVPDGGEGFITTTETILPLGRDLVTAETPAEDRQSWILAGQAQLKCFLDTVSPLP